MQLSSQQVERFYRIWFALLRFVNDRSELISAFPARGQEATLSVADEMQLRHALWADEALLEDFVATNPAGLSSRDLAIVTSWRGGDTVLLCDARAHNLHRVPLRSPPSLCLWGTGTAQTH